MPLRDLFISWWGYSFPPDDASVNDWTSHVQEVGLGVINKHAGVECWVPEVDVNIIDSLINLALITPHEVKLVNNCGFHHPVSPWVTLDHGGHFVDFDNISWSKAVLIKDQAIVSVHSSLDTLKELMCEVEVETHCLVINEIWNMQKVVLIWLFFGI